MEAKSQGGTNVIVVRRLSVVFTAMLLGVTILLVFSRAEAIAATGADVVAEARKHLGTPYGSTTCQKLVQEDCTCHTQLVYKRFGFDLPDSVAGQWNYGRRVARADLRRGDLVFFDTNKNGTLERFGDHVGIYTGDGAMIHASGWYGKVYEGRIRYTPNANWNTFYGARRLL